MDTLCKRNESEPTVIEGLYSSDIAQKVQKIFAVPDDHLKDVLAFQKDCTNEVRLAFRDLNIHTRSNYASFIKKAGRNIFPLLIASEYDYDNELGAGTGNTYTLYLEDGQEYRITPNANTGYSIYKSASHVIMGLGAMLGPYMKNPVASGWIKPLMDYKESVKRSLASIEACRNGFPYSFDKNPVEQVLRSSLEFIDCCLQEKSFSFEKWQTFNKNNFVNITRCMELAVKVQSESNVEALLKWKEMLGPELWREMYVFIPTVWPVSRSNPRIELFRNLLDEDRVDTHILSSEWPRNDAECRTTLGRIIGDRAIGRYVFGDECCKARTKVMSLSTEVDVVQDDAIKSIKEALIKNGINPRSE